MSTMLKQTDGTENNLMLKKAEKKSEKKKVKETKTSTLKQAAASAPEEVVVSSIETQYYGVLPLIQSQMKTGRTWTRFADLTDFSAGEKIWARCRLQESRCKGGLGFLVLRQRANTVQSVIDSKCEGLSREAVKWAGSIPNESIVDVYGTLVKPNTPISSTTCQFIELHIQKIFCVSKSLPELPFQLKDVNLSEGSMMDDKTISVGQDVRLDNRILDLRTLTSQSIFSIQAAVGRFFREFLMDQGFIEIHTPKLISGAAEGGANVFKLDYFNNLACLAQSPQLHKQMAICADFDRVFEVCPVFRAENSNTHRHLCEFTGLDIEMSIKEHYDEVLDLLDGLFKYIFYNLSKQCETHLKQIHTHCQTLPFTWVEKTPRLTYQEGIQMLRDAGCSASIPADTSKFDLSTELEKTLGRLVKEKYDTDFYMLVRYPLGVRPFYTMPCADDPTLSNSYDFFMRGEEIVSGAQRLHDPVLLTQRALACGIPLDSIKSYVDAFRLGAYPHGGCGVGLERVVMLFLGLGNIRNASLFPRDPKRLAP